MARETTLEENYEAFLGQLPELLKTHEGHVAVIHNGEVVDFFDSMERAVYVGNARFGPENFIAQKIVDEKPEVLSYSMAL